MADKIQDRMTASQRSARQHWVRPAVRRLSAGAAEVGTRPDVADGAFSFS